MNAHRGPEMNRRVRIALRARRFAREYTFVVAALAVVVVAVVGALSMRRVLAAKHQIRVLDCPVAHAVAHHHNESCFDDAGNLVCALPERDLHVHNESCYERQLVCGMEEGTGAHVHDEGCYDGQGKLVCGLEEGQGHVHDDGCYADVLVCDQVETTEEHVHGEGCFRMVAANEDAPEYTHPALTLQHDVYDADKNLQMRIEVAAPAGALPDGARLDATLLDPQKVDLDLLQQTLDEHADGAEGAEHGRVLRWQAVHLRFLDGDGHEIEPSADVTVRLTTEAVRTQDGRAIVRMDNPEGAKRVVKRGERKPRKEGEATERVMEQLTDDQLEAQRLHLDDDQVAFETSESNYYVVTATSLRHEMDATDGSSVRITLDAPPEAGVPADAMLAVDRIAPDTPEYDEYVERTIEKMQRERSDVGLAQFFDIHIVDGDGNELQPASPVDVRIELTDIPEVPNGFAAVHFKEVEAEDKEEGPASATELEELACGGENGTVTFMADSFSVYGIVYTVDFGYEVAGKLYAYTIKGGSPIGLRELAQELHIYEGAPRPYGSVEDFMGEVVDVEFSDPSLVWLQNVGSETTLQQILDEYDLHPQYPAGTSDEEVAAYGRAHYGNDWVLISLKPFATTEMLIITMADGTERLVAVTDDGEEVVVRAGEVTPKETITNPADTTIDLFDYWVVDNMRFTAGIDSNDGHTETKLAWPGYDTSSHNANNDNSLASSPSVNGDGYNQGINSTSPADSTYGTQYGEHNFKFNCSNSDTVPDGPYVYENGRWHWTTTNRTWDANHRQNCWTGSRDPYQGIVEPFLNENGYPTLTDTIHGTTTAENIGTDGEPLDYLFDPTFDHPGKQSYPNVSGLLYVDEQGYYNYDSADYAATFHYDERDPDYGTFTLTTHEPLGNNDASKQGFWPFGDRVFWHGMHVKSDFSMPQLHNGQAGLVLNPQGNYLPMTFEFTGDDDTWIYIDGVLVGDDGGIHGKSTVYIDFSTGDIDIVGATDGNHTQDFVDHTTLYDVFLNSGKYKPDWDRTKYATMEEDPDYIGNYFRGNTFKPGTHHTFDMFYIERGANESNLHIKYNLVSTADFNAHKAFYGENSTALARDQYQFELVGLDGMYQYTNVNPNDPNDDDYFVIEPTSTTTRTTGGSGDFAMAVMPEGKTTAKPGDPISATVSRPIYNPEETITLGDKTTVLGQVYATGVVEDGNVNFGTADITDLSAAMDADSSFHPAYRYIVREIVPDDALSVYGVRFADCDDDQRRYDGPFLLNGILYDNTTYYMIGYPVPSGTGNYSWKKKYYTDDSFTERATTGNTPGFSGFTDYKNYYVPDYVPLTLDLTKRNGEDHSQFLPSSGTEQGAEFELWGAALDKATGKWHTTGYSWIDHGETQAPTGSLSFSNLGPGYYILKETKAPEGFEKPGNDWLIEVKRENTFDTKPPTNELVMTIKELMLDGSEVADSAETTAITDTISGGQVTARNAAKAIDNYPFKFAVEKRWEGAVGADDTILANSEIKVSIGRYTLEDVAGTLNIRKEGIPSDGSVNVTYVIELQDPDTGVWEEVTTITKNSGWSTGGVNVTEQPLALKPGHYRVTEMGDAQDPKYSYTHTYGDDASVHVWEGDIVDKGSEEITFGASWAQRTGTLRISSTLANGSHVANSQITPNVQYAIYGPDDPSLTTPLGTCGYTNGSFETFSLPVGTYYLVETGWPSLTRTSHSNACVNESGDKQSYHTMQKNGENVSVILAEVVADDTKDYRFTATYEVNNKVWVMLYKYGTINGDPDNCYIAYSYQTGAGAAIYDERPRLYGPLEVSDSSDYLTFTCCVGSFDDRWGNDYNDDDDYDPCPRAGTDFFDESFLQYVTNIERDSDSGWKAKYTVRIPWSAIAPNNTVYMGNRWGLIDQQDGSDTVSGITLTDGTKNWDISAMRFQRLTEEDIEDNPETLPNAPVVNRGTRSLNAAPKAGARDVSAKKLGDGSGDTAQQRAVTIDTQTTVTPVTIGAPPEAAPASPYADEAEYLIDTSFKDPDDSSKPFTVTLKYGNRIDDDNDGVSDAWRRTIEGLPAVSPDGKRYYYYISGVEETDMPKNTVCTVVFDDNGRQVLSHRTDMSLTGATLAVRNDVGKPADLDVVKVDGTTNPPKPLGGAVFRLMRQVTAATIDPDTQEEVAATYEAVTGYAVVKRGTTTSINVDANGNFTVPEEGATIKDVDPGTYVLKEVSPPPGYVMSTTDYPFTVGWDGVVDDAPDYISTTPATQTTEAIYTMTIPNTPGEELPMSGGPGTVAGTVAGMALMTVGALALLRNRRPAHVGERA